MVPESDPNPFLPVRLCGLGGEIRIRRQEIIASCKESSDLNPNPFFPAYAASVRSVVKLRIPKASSFSPIPPTPRP